jgi:hypothetical protein
MWRASVAHWLRMSGIAMVSQKDALVSGPMAKRRREADPAASNTAQLTATSTPIRSASARASPWASRDPMTEFSEAPGSATMPRQSMFPGPTPSRSPSGHPETSLQESISKRSVDNAFETLRKRALQERAAKLLAKGKKRT